LRQQAEQVVVLPLYSLKDWTDQLKQELNLFTEEAAFTFEILKKANINYQHVDGEMVIIQDGVWLTGETPGGSLIC
jgi:hypothetical protein